MPTIIGAIIVVSLLFAGLNYVAETFVNAIKSILTLSFLPSGLNMLKDSDMNTTAIPIIGVVINYFMVVFVNVVDFLIWIPNYIPGIHWLINLVYTAPDIDSGPNAFTFFGSHRSFFTHSVLNPILVGYLIFAYLIKKMFSRTKWGNIIGNVAALIGLTFACHLLADTMPRGWKGTALIKVFSGSLNGWQSYIWLLANAFAAMYASMALAKTPTRIEQKESTQGSEFASDDKLQEVATVQEVAPVQKDQDNIYQDMTSPVINVQSERQQNAPVIDPDRKFSESVKPCIANSEKKEQVVEKQNSFIPLAIFIAVSGTLTALLNTRPTNSVLASVMGGICLTSIPWSLFALIKPKPASFYTLKSRWKAFAFFVLVFFVSVLIAILLE